MNKVTAISLPLLLAAGVWVGAQPTQDQPAFGEPGSTEASAVEVGTVESIEKQGDGYSIQLEGNTMDFQTDRDVKVTDADGKTSKVSKVKEGNQVSLYHESGKVSEILIQS